MLNRAKVGMSRNQDRRDMKSIPHQTLMKLHAAHYWHLEIDNQALGKTAGQGNKKFLPRPKCMNLKGARAQQPAQSLEHGRIIVNNGNPGKGHRHE